MKSAKFLVLLAIGLFLSCYVLISDATSAYRSHLEGTWYSGGDRNKVTRIVSTRDGLEARNEHGQTRRREYAAAAAVACGLSTGVELPVKFEAIGSNGQMAPIGHDEPNSRKGCRVAGLTPTLSALDRAMHLP